MGQVIPSVIKALSCETCAKYVCNSMDLKSHCSDCCDFELHTSEIDISDDDVSEISIDIGTLHIASK